MGYTATVTDKKFVNGKLVVTIEYADGKNSIVDTMECRSPQDSDWVTKETSRRCEELDGLVTFASTVATGAVDTEIKPPVVDAPDNTYKEKLDLFLKAQNALRMGIITEDTKAFAELKQWLTDNFLPEYLDLFVG